MKLIDKYKGLPSQKKTAIKILIALLVLLIALIPLYFIADCSLKSTRFKSAQSFIVYESNFKEYYGYTQSFELDELKREDDKDVVYMRVYTRDGKIVSCKVTFRQDVVNGVKKEVASWTTYDYTTYQDKDKEADYFAKAKSYIEHQKNFKEFHGEIKEIKLVKLICEEFTEAEAVLMKITVDNGKEINCKVTFNNNEPVDWSLYTEQFKEN